MNFELACSETTLTVHKLARKTRMFCESIEKGIVDFLGGLLVLVLLFGGLNYSAGRIRPAGRRLPNGVLKR
jgi:hypothetical protein